MTKSFLCHGVAIIFLSACLFASCHQVEDIPFPEELAEYPQPQMLPLEFTALQPLHWDTTGKGTITPTVFPLDFKRLKGMTYDSSGFKPLPFAVTESSFSFSALPSRALNLEGMTKHPLRKKTEPLPLPASSVKLQKPERAPALTIDVKIWQQIAQLNIIVYQMIKDQSGAIWFTTDNGIYRFDGTKLTNMIPGVYCYSFFFDKNGTLWYLDASDQKDAAIVKADFKNKTLVKYFTDLSITSITNIVAGDNGDIWQSGSIASPPALINPEEMLYYTFDSKSGFNSGRYYKIAVDTEARAWIGSRHGVDIIDRKANKVIHIGKENGLNTDSIDVCAAGPDGRIWAAGYNVLEAIDIKSGKITHYRLDGDNNNQRIYCLKFDKSGQLWVGRRLDLSIINFNNNTLRHIGSTGGLSYNDNVVDLLEYQPGQILVTGLSSTASRGGIYSIEQSGKTVFPFRNTAILSSTEDSKGNLWVGTENGLLVVDSARKTYWRLDTDNGLANPFIQSVTEQDGKVVITTNGGYNIFNPSKSEWERVTRKEGLQTDSVYSLTEDHKKNLWITGTSAGIFQYDRSSGNILNLTSSGGLNGNFVVQASVIPGNNDIWMVTNESGPNIIDPINNSIRFIKNVPGIDNISSKGIVIDSHGRIWITGTPTYGLYMIDLTGKKIAHFTTQEGLADNTTYSILEYNGRMLVCTNQKVNIITPPELSSHTRWEVDLLKHSEGLKKSTSSFVSDAMSKRGDYLWGDYGLGIIYGIEPDTSMGTNYITGIRIMGKDIAFADPQKVQADTGQQKSKVSRSSIGYAEKGDFKWDSLSGPYHLPVNLSLPNDQKIIQFSFTELGTVRQDSLQFAYILEGIDKKWTVTKDLQTETYLNLSPGNYIFKVASRWQNGKWNTPATFNFTIRPPWYATWWAYLIYFIVAVSLLRLYIIFRSRKLVRENKVLEEKVRHRTKQLQESLENLRSTQTQLIQSEKMASLGELAAGIAHEIQNPLNFVNNFSEINAELATELAEKVDQGNYEEVKVIATDIKENSEKISHHGKRADGIVKGMLQHSRNSSGLKEPTNINTLCDEYLRLAYHGLRAKDKSFNSGMNTDFDNSIPLLSIVPQDIGRVILNLLTNAFYAVNERAKSEGGNYKALVSISTKKVNDKVEIIISDNGNGIPQSIIDKIFQPFFTTKPTGHGTGLGLSMSYEIITKAHGGELKVESKEGEGTRFYIVLSLKNN